MVEEVGPQGELINLLREIFRFGEEDLNFGIYRVMNQKRKDIKNFLEKGLINEIIEQLKIVSEEARNDAKEKLNELKKKIVKNFGKEAFENGELRRKFKDTPLGERYREKLQKVKEIKVSEDLEKEIYNHIYTFFSRYYDKGDFMPTPRATEKYNIPYHGEETVLHWANKDQYYIKTSEQFKKYTFRTKGLTTSFRAVGLEEEKGNVKPSENRYFVIREDKPFEINGETLDVYFEYRPITEGEKEEKKFGKKVQITQRDINKFSFGFLKKKLSDEKRAESLLKEDDDGTPLEKNLYKYTTRNKSDYFIHKDLKSFLEGEIGSYIKNEVLDVRNVEKLDKEDFNRYLIEAKVIRNISTKIIQFLAQIEEFQKRLWEKKKFVIQTEYVISLKTLDDYLSKEDYNEFKEAVFKKLKNSEEYQNDFASVIRFTFKKPRNNIFVRDISFGDVEVKIRYKKRFFKKESFHHHIKGSEEELWHEKTKCVRKNELVDAWFVEHPPKDLPETLSYDDVLFIDTRYFDEDFKYNLLRKISECKELDEEICGILIRSENWQALNLLSGKFYEDVQLIYIDPPFNTGEDFLYKDKYRDSSWITLMDNRFDLAKDLLNEKGNIYVHLDHNANFLGRHILNHHFCFEREIIWNTGENISGFKSIAPRWIRQHDTIFHYSKSGGYLFNKLWTLLKDAEGELEEKTLNLLQGAGSLDIIGNDKDNLYIEQWVDGEIKKKTVGNVGVKAKGDIWNDILSFQYSEPGIATEIISFDTQKPESLLRRIIQSSSNPGGYVMDYFLGSGTTAVVAHKLGRKWIGIENGEFFEDIPLLRLKSVLIGDRLTYVSKNMNWQGGGMLKYQKLEQYEDSLENIEFEQKNIDKYEDYFVKYMLGFETKKSKTFLNTDNMKDPFNYKIKTLDKIGQPPKMEKVDLVETFNYLIGLKVAKIMKTEQNGRDYVFVFGGADGVKTLVVWRSIKDLDFEKDKKVIEKVREKLGPEETYVNGDAGIKDFKQIESEFKSRMWE